MADETNQARLADALLDPAVYSLPVGASIERLETHISFVFLAGLYAYKIKKAVDLGFLDFRDLSARQFYCREELRLNRRLAPQLYLDVVPITGSATHPVFGATGPSIEYAVKMRRFAQEALLDRMLARGALSREHIDQLANTAAEFHRQTTRASAADRFGTPAAILQPACDNFKEIRAAIGASPELEALEQWTTEQHRLLAPVFLARKQDGFVRECHGDLHLRNVALVDDVVTFFDCIEFDPNLRWIDVMSDVAFMAMDLHDRKQPAFARRFLNRYLEITGDYGGLQVLRFYIVYRAMVRAKIHCLRAFQPGVSQAERARLLEQYRGYVGLATAQSCDSRPAVVITHSLSGSGKTSHTQPLLESLGAIRVRSDIERKRLQ